MPLTTCGLPLLRFGSPTVAFASLTNTTSIVTLGEHGNADNEEKVYFCDGSSDCTSGMGARSRNPESAEYGNFHIPAASHEPLKEIAHPASACALTAKQQRLKNPLGGRE